MEFTVQDLEIMLTIINNTNFRGDSIDGLYALKQKIVAKAKELKKENKG